MELISVDQAAELVDVPTNRIRQWVRDGSLILTVGQDGKRAIPRDFIVPASDDMPAGVLKSLPAVITLLRDVGYRDEEIIDWLYRADESLPGTPVAALRENRGTEVKRRAQASGF